MPMLRTRIIERLRCQLYSTNAPKKKKYFARKLVGFSCTQMFNVVADVKNYDKFVPFCSKSIVIKEHPGKLLIGKLVVGFPPINETYTSTVTLQRPKMVKAVCKDGRLFSLLETNWKFNPGLESNLQTCIIDFNIVFEFKSSLYGSIATLFFNQLVEQMEDAFLNEAKKRYGKESLPVHKLQVVHS